MPRHRADKRLNSSSRESSTDVGEEQPRAKIRRNVFVDFDDILNMPGSLPAVAHYPSPTRPGQFSHHDDIAGQSSPPSVSQRSGTVPGYVNLSGQSQSDNFENNSVHDRFPLAGHTGPTTSQTSDDGNRGTQSAQESQSSHNEYSHRSLSSYEAIGSNHQPAVVEEDSNTSSSISEDSVVADDVAISYTIVENSTQRNRSKLIDSFGFSYTLKKATTNTTYWRCSTRNSHVQCRASVMQNGDEYVPGIHPHLHGSPGCTPTTAGLMAEVKKRAADDLFKPATAIVEEVILEMIDTNEFPDDLPAMQNLARAANRLRQAKRPENPTDLNFPMDDSMGSTRMMFGWMGGGTYFLPLSTCWICLLKRSDGTLMLHSKLWAHHLHSSTVSMHLCVRANLWNSCPCFSFWCLVNIPLITGLWSTMCCMWCFTLESLQL